MGAGVHYGGRPLGHRLHQYDHKARRQWRNGVICRSGSTRLGAIFPGRRSNLPI